MTEPWPVELRLKPDKHALEIAFDNGENFSLPAEYLRVESPSAEVQGHGPNQRKIVGGKRDVTIVKLEPVGNYAVRLVFADGHETGLYTWTYLRKLGREHERIWADYLALLDSRGLNR